ncbi:unnamed protein product, partial [Oncorhynchus mykiss]
WSDWYLCPLITSPAWRHCQSCARYHPCGNSPGLEGCFNCGSLKHKRRACPLKDKRRTDNKSKAMNSKRTSGAQRRANKLKKTTE